MSFFNYKFFIFILVLIFNYPLKGEEYENILDRFSFNFITIEDGLPSNHVFDICQDKFGYIWFATDEGISKYNGINIKNYYFYDLKRKNLSFVEVYSITWGPENTLWAGTKSGLYKYNSKKDSFEIVNILENQTFTVFNVKDFDNSIIIATEKGILYNYKNQWKKLIDKELFPEIASDSITNILIDSKKNIWFTVYADGLWYYDYLLKKLIRPKTTEKLNNLINQTIQCIYEDYNGDIYIGTLNNSFFVKRASSNIFKNIIIDPSNNYSNRVNTFFRDNRNRLFVGTRNGLYLYENGKFYHYAHVYHPYSKLSNNSILCSLVDKNGILWIGTHFKGVNYVDLYKKSFIHFHSADYYNDLFLNYNVVYCFAEDKNGNLYIGTENGINIFSFKNKKFQYLLHDERNKNSLSYNDVKSIVVDKNDNLWIGTNLGGLNYYDTKTKKFKHYKHKIGTNNSIPSNKIYKLHLDKDENLWIITNDQPFIKPGKLSLKKKNTEEFITYDIPVNNGIYEVENGDMYIGGINGIWKYERNKRKFSFIRNDSLINKVWVIHKDKFDLLWIGSYYGLVSYNLNTNNFKSYKFPIYGSVFVFGILEDNNHCLWVSTNKGLWKLIRYPQQPEQLYFKHYQKKDGLQGNVFNYNAFYKTKEGMLLFGGTEGFNAFYPDNIKDNPFYPKVYISSISVNNKELKPGEVFNGDTILNNSVIKKSFIKLKPKDIILTIQFDAIHYSQPAINKFKYILENFDNKWQYAKATNNYVTYTNLPPGKYTFKVYSINYDNIESKEPAILEIKVIPPLWDTLFFKIGLLIASFLIGLFIYFKRLKTLEKHKNYLKKIVEERTAELVKINEELKQQRDELIARSEEITAQRDEIERKSKELEDYLNKIKILSEFGQKITSTLNLDDINNMIFDYVSSLLDTSVFGIGIYDEKSNSIVFSKFMEYGIALEEFSSSLDDPTSCAAWCFKNQKIIFTNDFDRDYKLYITERKIRSSQMPKSLIYLPLTVKNKRIGILTVQSYNKNAYNENDLQTLQTLASYIAIALDNAEAYELVRQQMIELEKHQNELERLVYERTKDFEAAKIKAEESDRLKSAFLANMSHEIRTPLNAIIGFISLLEDEDISPEEKRQFYQIIKSNGYSLLNIINDIIDFSKIEAGQLSINYSTINLPQLLIELYHIYKEDMKRTYMRTEVNLLLNNNYLDKINNFCTDPVRFKQIFINLLNNAIKFTKKGFVEFGIKEMTDDGYIVFYVKDTGIGIARENFEKIFERFVKIESDPVSLFRGAGLGLSITKYLVEKMNGKIWLESELGKGTTFYFSLPFKESYDKVNEIIKESNKAYENKNYDWSNKTLLFVEDEKSNYLVINSMLKKTGINILWAKDGNEALDFFNIYGNSINVILMDIKIPNIDGIKVAETIKEYNPDVIIIAQTAHALPEEEHAIRSLYFDDYLPKPFNKDKLLTLLKKNLEKQ